VAHAIATELNARCALPNPASLSRPRRLLIEPASADRRKQRSWPDAAGVKGCTVHSFKGWETPALVMGIGQDRKSKRLAYVAMTRIRVVGPGRPAVS
jgi:hypothetical protein